MKQWLMIQKLHSTQHAQKKAGKSKLRTGHLKLQINSWTTYWWRGNIFTAAETMEISSIKS